MTVKITDENFSTVWEGPESDAQAVLSTLADGPYLVSCSECEFNMHGERVYCESCYEAIMEDMA